MQAPWMIWEKPMTKWLLDHRAWLIAGLVGTAAVSTWFAVRLAQGKDAIPAAGWLAYMVAP